MRGQRGDGLPREMAHSAYSTRQRTIVVTFRSLEAAQAFDELADDDVIHILTMAVANRIVAPKNRKGN